MTQLLDPRTEELIAKLDEFRDYGDLGYEGVVAGVRAGRLKLYPVPETQKYQQPMIAGLDGVRIKGTGATRRLGWTRIAEEHKSLFQDAALLDFQKMYAALVKASTENLDPRAMKIWWEHFLGAPVKSLEGGASKEALELMTMLAKGTSTQTKPIDAEGRYIDVDSS